MRGIAAALVVLYHFGHAGFPKLAPNGHLAVDFFFVLSGYVLAGAFEGRLRRGLSVREFAQQRFVRFYPLYFAGLFLGGANALLTSSLSNNWKSSAMIGLAMIPDPTSTRLYPLNTPAWSLAFEWAINIFFATLLVRLRSLALFSIMVLLAGSLWLTVDQARVLDIGMDWQTVLPALARTVFAFCTGMLIFRSAGSKTQSSWLVSIVIPIVLIILLTVPIAPKLAIPFQMSAALLICPALVWIGAHFDVPAALRMPMTWLGEISFPLYAIHYPLLGFARLAVKRFGVPPLVAEFSFLIIVGGFSWLLARFFDEPVRRFLRRSLGRPATG